MWAIFVLLMVSLTCSQGGRCRGRVNVGSGCKAQCDFSRGVWEQTICTPAREFYPCEYSFKNNGQSCEYTFYGQYLELDPPLTGDCADTTSPCYEPDIYNKVAGTCEYFCETLVDNGPPTCQYEYHQRYLYREGQIPIQYGTCNSRGPCDETPCAGLRKVETVETAGLGRSQGNNMADLCDTVNHSDYQLPVDCRQLVGSAGGQWLDWEACRAKCNANPECTLWKTKGEKPWCWNYGGTGCHSVKPKPEFEPHTYFGLSGCSSTTTTTTKASTSSRSGSCSCNGYISSKGQGECRTRYRRKKFCYVDSSASCEKIKVPTDSSRYYSFEACNLLCPCNGYINSKGQGECKTRYKGKYFCYVDSTASCEKIRSSDGSRYYSFDACPNA